MATKLFLCAALLGLAALIVASDENAHVQVHITNGPVVGETFELDRQRTIYRFLGIPYAEPPVGPLRFHKTRPLQRKWSEPLQALKWPVRCIQDVKHPWNSNNADDSFEFNHEVSEDCLMLNIWTPGLESDETKLRPVIVWIHGGALFMGSTSAALYDSKTLANMADAVVVTVNYRLSTMGFLYSDKVEGVKGNAGLWDMAMALEWVQDNIRYFGGNPQQVTIVGESAGGWAVSGLILSPISRNLFHNAFMMSGAADNRVIAKPENIVKMFLKGIRKVGCATEQDTSITQEVMDCINNLELAQIDQIVHQAYDNKLTFPSLCTVDGEFFTDEPFEMLKKGDFKTNVNLIVDSVENEGALMLGYFEQFHPTNPQAISLQEAKDFTRKILTQSTEGVQVTLDVDKIEKLYFNGLHPLDNQDLFRNRATMAYGDWLLNCPVGTFARAVKRYSSDKASVFQLFYRLHTGMQKLRCPKWAYACHVEDVFTLFALPFQNPDMFTDRERDASAEMVSFLYDFIRTGKPNKRMPEWQEYFLLDKNTVIAPYYELTNHVRTHENFKFNLKEYECDLMMKST